MTGRLAGVLALVLVMSLSALPVSASQSEGEVQPLSTYYLASWESWPTDNGNGFVKICGYSEATQPVSSISVRIYLQKWNGSGWTNVDSVYKPASGTDYVWGEKTIAAQRGATYRTKSEHSVSHNGKTDFKTYISSSIVLK